jgi:hypothetical protein
VRDHIRQDFHINITAVEKHSSYGYHTRRYVVLGKMCSYLKNAWGPGDFEWGFRIIILKHKNGEMEAELFRACDSSGSYSDFFRALIWKRVRLMLIGVLS